MSDQNPIHRDRDRRGKGEQPWTDDRETFAEKEATIERHAPFPEHGQPGLTDEEQKKLDEQAAEQRFEQIGEDVKESGSAKGDTDGN